MNLLFEKHTAYHIKNIFNFFLILNFYILRSIVFSHNDNVVLLFDLLLHRVIRVF